MAWHSLTRDAWIITGSHSSVITGAGHQSKGESHVDSSCGDNVEIFTERYVDLHMACRSRRWGETSL